MIVFLSIIVMGAVVLGIVLWNKNHAAVFSRSFIEADAIVLNIHLNGISIKEEVQANIQLQVQPEMGKSFVLETKNMLSMADYIKLQPGTRIQVKYHAKNRKELTILRESYAGDARLVKGSVEGLQVITSK